MVDAMAHRSVTSVQYRFFTSLTYGLLYPASTVLMWALGVSKALTVEYYWILYFLMAGLMAVSVNEWSQKKLKREAHLFSWFYYLMLSAPVFASFLTESTAARLVPMLILPFAFLLGRIVPKFPWSFKRPLLSLDWVAYSIVAGLVAAIVFSLRPETLILFVLGCLIGWNFDRVSDRLGQVSRSVFFVGVSLIGFLVEVLYAVDGYIQGEFMLIFMLALPVMVYAKGKYLLNVENLKRVKSNEDQIRMIKESRENVDTGLRRGALMWRFFLTLGVIMMLSGLYLLEARELLLSYILIFSAILGIIGSLILYVSQRKLRIQKEGS